MFAIILAHAAEAGGGSSPFPSVHPILVNFTAALIPTSLAADLLGRIFRRDSLRSTGWWTLLLAAIVTPLTALAGWLWMRSMEDMDHWQMPYHKWIGISLAGGFILLALWRGWMWRRDLWPGVPYFLAGALVLGLLGFQGELGGSMSFGHALLISDDDSQPNHGNSHAGHLDHNASDTMPSSMNHHDHGSMEHPAMPDGWKDHINVSESRPTTRP